MRQLILLPLLALLWPSDARALPAHSGGDEDDKKNASPNGLIAQPWYRPHHVILQTAGGQGVIAGGVGYTTARGRIDIDVLGGYVPKKYSITPMGIFTGKATYSPWTLAVGEGRWQVRPFSVGAFVSHTASNGIVESRDDKYYKGYYWWSSRTRIGGFVGGRVGRAVGTTAAGRPRMLSAYYELGSNDLYVTSLANNLGGLPLRDILTLGFGVKLDL